MTSTGECRWHKVDSAEVEERERIEPFFCIDNHGDLRCVVVVVQGVRCCGGGTGCKVLWWWYRV